MSLDAFFEIGTRVAIGTHRFSAESIMAFARRFDPQPFHIDETLAAGSVFGALCASGWHTASVWMRLNVERLAEFERKPWPAATPRPEWGPSPGFQELRWPKPVFAGADISFASTALAHRRLASRPGWRVLTVLAEAADSQGDKVLEFEGAVLVKAA